MTFLEFYTRYRIRKRVWWLEECFSIFKHYSGADPFSVVYDREEGALVFASKKSNPKGKYSMLFKIRSKSYVVHKWFFMNELKITQGIIKK